MRITILATLLVAAGAAEAQEIQSVMERTVEIRPRGGVYEADLKTILSTARVESMQIRPDWWTGPSDDRAGDPRKAGTGTFRFQISVERAWRDLPAVTRNLRLTGEIDVPAELVKDRKARGPWKFRQAGNEDRAVRLVLHLRYRVSWGKSLALPDLRFNWFVPTGRTAPAPDERASLHDRAPVLRVAPGGTIVGEAEIHNAGFGDVVKAGWTVTLRPWAKPHRGGAMLEAAEIRHLREREKLGRKVSLKIPARTRPGEYALVFTIDPAGRVGELDEANNTLVFPLLVVAEDEGR